MLERKMATGLESMQNMAGGQVLLGVVLLKRESRNRMLKCGHADQTLSLKNHAFSVTVTIESEEKGAK
jgi:hypothetical protein